MSVGVELVAQQVGDEPVMADAAVVGGDRGVEEQRRARRVLAVAEAEHRP